MGIDGTITVGRGFAEAERDRAARLFWHAFSGKLNWVMGPEPLALQLLMTALQPDSALSARDGSGALVGLAGLKDRRSGLIVARSRDMAQVYGRFGAAWRGPLLDLTEQMPEEGQMILDGLFVDPAARGSGIGTALIESACAEARLRKFREIRLDVSDRNARARALYVRRGFRSAGHRRMGPLSFVFGYRRLETMVRSV